MISLYLDEDVPPLLASLLRAEQYDVVSAHEVGVLGKTDEEQLLYAASQGRAILTFNQRHFRPLYDEWWSAGRGHSGIVLSRAYKIDEIGELVRLARNLMVRNSPEDLANHLVYLQQYV